MCYNVKYHVLKYVMFSKVLSEWCSDLLQHIRSELDIWLKTESFRLHALIDLKTLSLAQAVRWLQISPNRKYHSLF